MDPSGKVVLLTGGAGGLGRAFSRALLSAGAKVAVCDVDVQFGQHFVSELQKEFGDNNTIFLNCDVTDHVSFEEVFKVVKKTFQRIDIVINNAGIAKDVLWEKEIDINVKGVVGGTLLAFKYLGKEAGGAGGLVVNIASMAGLAPLPGTPVYCATKHAVVGLTRSYGDESHVQRTAVSVVALCPGYVDTPLVRDAPKFRLHPAAGGSKAGPDAVGIGTPEQTAEALLRVIREASPGSVWATHLGDTYKINFPRLVK